MTFGETFLTSFLFAEFAILFLLTIPLRTSKQWNNLFKSRLGKFFAKYGNIAFFSFLTILTVFLMDTIIDLGKYGGVQWQLKLKFDDLNLFRNQYNFYKAGLAIFHFLIIRRLVVLISAQARLKKEKHIAKINALGALAAFHTLAEVMQNGDDEPEEQQNDDNDFMVDQEQNLIGD